MNKADVYQLIEKFETSSLSELSLEMEGVKVSVKKGDANLGASQRWNSTDVSIGAEDVISTSNHVTITTMSSNSVPVTTKSITAPLVGTFYRAASPGEKAFVEIGQQVKKGDVVGIIEAMKLMNEIIAEEDGVVSAIEVEDGHLVEYGQVLVRLS